MPPLDWFDFLVLAGPALTLMSIFLIGSEIDRRINREDAQ
jgi:hypothetical protein